MSDSPPVCDYEGSDYQTRFWDEGQRAYEDQSERLALRHMLPATGKRFVELGAGAGRQTPLLSQFEHVVLVDYSRTQLQQAQARLGHDPARYTYVAANVYALPFADAAFDSGMMVRVMHHLADVPAALAEIRRTMAPQAQMLFEFANKRNLKAILRYWTRRQDWNPFSPEPVEFVALNYDFHPAQMRQWLDEAGFDALERRALSYFRLGLLKRTLPTGLLVSLDGLLQPTGQLAPYSPSVFVATQARGEGDPTPNATLFACPGCHGALSEAGDVVLCSECGTRYAVRDGIYDFKEPMHE